MSSKSITEISQDDDQGLQVALYFYKHIISLERQNAQEIHPKWKTPNPDPIITINGDKILFSDDNGVVFRETDDIPRTRTSNI